MVLTQKKSSTKKIAFLFLTMDSVKHERLWEEFFSIADDKKYTIYAHPASITKKTPDWIKNNKVKVDKTSWCSINLVKAQCNMIEKAMGDRHNTHFMLLSGDCIPLYTFNETYKKVTSLKRSCLHYHLSTPFLDKENERDIKMYHASQFNILTRKNAKDLLKLWSTPKGKKFLRDMKGLYRKSGVYNSSDTWTIMQKTHAETGATPWGNWDSDYYWNGGCPDELYPINWFIELYGKPCSKKFKQNIRNRQTTYVEMNPKDGYMHPYVLNKPQVTTEWRWVNMCYGESIFARKFAKTAAKSIGMNCNY